MFNELNLPFKYSFAIELFKIKPQKELQLLKKSIQSADFKFDKLSEVP